MYDTFGRLDANGNVLTRQYIGLFPSGSILGLYGGAIVPVVIGSLGDHIGLRAALCVLFLPLAYIFSMGFWARPLITNKTI